MAMRIWHQSFTVLENLPDYRAALEAHMQKVARSDTEVVLHGMDPETYATEYPGNDIRYAYLHFLHAGQFAINGLAAQRAGYDAYAISTLPDPALRETQSILDIPVVGYGESSMHLASMLGQRFGILVFIDELIPLLRDNARRYGLESRVADIRHVGFRFGDVGAGFADPGPTIERFKDAARDLIRDGAEVIIPGEAPLCVLLAAQGVFRIDDVPVLDALAATIKMTELMVDLRRVAGVEIARTGYYREAPPEERVDELIRFYGMDRLMREE